MINLGFGVKVLCQVLCRFNVVVAQGIRENMKVFNEFRGESQNGELLDTPGDTSNEIAYVNFGLLFSRIWLTLRSTFSQPSL